MLHHGCLKGAARGGGAELIGKLNDRRHMRGDVLGVEAGDGLAVYQHAVAAEDDGCLDAFALPDGRDEVAYGWHVRSAKGCRKHTRSPSEVKRLIRLKLPLLPDTLRLLKMLSNPPHFAMRIPRGLYAGALFVCATIAGACDGPTNYPGQSQNATQAFFVHAMNGGAFAGSTAITFPGRSVTRIDGTYQFDVAFDIDTNGNVMLLPPELVGQNPSGNRLVGIITGIGSYDAITAAPTVGYTVDSITVVQRGQAVAVQAQEPVCLSSNPVAPYLYAKIVVDSIDLVGRGIYGRAMIGGDCGYRQLIAGIPSF
jgi:hypothetical protein